MHEKVRERTFIENPFFKYLCGVVNTQLLMNKYFFKGVKHRNFKR